MLKRTEGIILRTERYGEADLIVTCLTLSNGIIKAFARSPRKTGSRFGSSLEPLTHARISLLGKEQSMPKITQSDIINSFHHLREDLKDFINMSKFIEILISLIPEGIPNKRLFSFFLKTMNLLKSSGEKVKDTLYLISQIRLLSLLGYAPRLNGCGKCGTNSLDFYPSLGTILCDKCAITHVVGKEPPLRVTAKVINFYSHSIRWPIYISNRLKPPHKTISELSYILDKHLNCLLGKSLMSSEFFAYV